MKDNINDNDDNNIIWFFIENDSSVSTVIFF